MKNSKNKIYIFVLLILLVFWTTDTFAAEKDKTKVKVSPISMDMATKLITTQVGDIRLKDMSSNGVEPDSNQCFKISHQTEHYYLISSTQNLPQNQPPICALLLFNSLEKIVSVIDILDTKDGKRPWICLSTEAVSFSDYYPDGNLKIIALYLVAPPSSEDFILPVVLKMNFKNPFLIIDETLTSKLRGKHVKTIQAARSVLNRK